MRCFITQIFICYLLLWKVDAGNKTSITLTTFEYSIFMFEESDLYDGNGLMIDIVKAAFNAVNIEAIVQFYPVARARKLLQDGDVQCFASSSAMYNSAPNDYAWHDFLRSRFLLFYKKDRFPNGLNYRSVSDLKGKRCGLLIKSRFRTILNDAGVEYDEVSSLEQNIQKLVWGRVDVVIAGEYSAKRLIENEFSDYSSMISFEKTAFSLLPMSLIFRENSPDHQYFIDEFRRGCDLIRNNGVMGAIKVKYGFEPNAFEIPAK